MIKVLTLMALATPGYALEPATTKKLLAFKGYSFTTQIPSTTTDEALSQYYSLIPENPKLAAKQVFTIKSLVLHKDDSLSLELVQGRQEFKAKGRYLKTFDVEISLNEFLESGQCYGKGFEAMSVNLNIDKKKAVKAWATAYYTPDSCHNDGTITYLPLEIQ